MNPTILILLSAYLVLVSGASPDEEIRQAEKSWAAKVTSGDLAGLERILADQLIYAHSTGAVESKTEYLGRLRGGGLKYDRIEHQNITVRILGDAAVAHSTVRMTGKSETGAFDNKMMMIHVWVRQSGAWKLAAHQTTRLP